MSQDGPRKMDIDGGGNKNLDPPPLLADGANKSPGGGAEGESQYDYSSLLRGDVPEHSFTDSLSLLVAENNACFPETRADYVVKIQHQVAEWMRKGFPPDLPDRFRDLPLDFLEGLTPTAAEAFKTAAQANRGLLIPPVLPNPADKRPPKLPTDQGLEVAKADGGKDKPGPKDETEGSSHPKGGKPVKPDKEARKGRADRPPNRRGKGGKGAGQQLVLPADLPPGRNNQVHSDKWLNRPDLRKNTHDANQKLATGGRGNQGQPPRDNFPFGRRNPPDRLAPFPVRHLDYQERRRSRSPVQRVNSDQHHGQQYDSEQPSDQSTARLLDFMCTSVNLLKDQAYRANRR